MIATAPLIFYRLCLLTEFAEKGLQCLLSDWSGAKQSSAEEYVSSTQYSQECMIANELVGVWTLMMDIPSCTAIAAVQNKGGSEAQGCGRTMRVVIAVPITVSNMPETFGHPRSCSNIYLRHSFRIFMLY